MKARLTFVKKKFTLENDLVLTDSCVKTFPPPRKVKAPLRRVWKRCAPGINGWQCSHAVFHRQGWTRLAAGVYGIYDQQGNRECEIQRGDRERLPCPQLRGEALRDQGGALPSECTLVVAHQGGTDGGFLFVDR